jgi:hypothetical protein
MRQIVALLFVAGCQASASASGNAAVGAEATERKEAAACVGPDAEKQDRGAPLRFSGNDKTIALDCGTYHGDLVVSGNGLTVNGAGRGATIIDGKLKVSGNHIRVRGITVRGQADVSGNDNDVSGAELTGGGNVRGNN